VHVLRVARLVGQTARKLMLSGKFPDIDESFVELVATASFLHDVGKIAAPDRILLKAGGLTHEERDVIKTHTTDGAKLLKQARLTMGHSQYLDLGMEIALTHHEWYDGRGYPHGLAGVWLPLAGKICAGADVCDAVTSRRPYKAAWETAKAVELIRAQAGTQFDPAVVDAFLEVLEERERVCLVRWNDDFSVGNLHIDEQHSILIDTINQLASAESLHNHHSVLMIIDELASYAAFHFNYEERLIEAAGYPQLEEHRIIHGTFIRWVAELREDYVAFGKRPLGESVLNYLRDWLSHHILGEDQRYRPFIQDIA
jgi:hemerythrin-like metal-binding protein